MPARALLPVNPYGYIVLRIVVCAVSVYAVVKAVGRHKLGWVWAFGICVALYRPITCVHLNRELRSIINVATIALVITSLYGLLGTIFEPGL